MELVKLVKDVPKVFPPEVGRALRIEGPSVSQCIERGKVLVGNEPEICHKLIN